MPRTIRMAIVAGAFTGAGIRATRIEFFATRALAQAKARVVAA